MSHLKEHSGNYKKIYEEALDWGHTYADYITASVNHYIILKILQSFTVPQYNVDSLVDETRQDIMNFIYERTGWDGITRDDCAGLFSDIDVAVSAVRGKGLPPK
ncbi:MAG: hypothetical protein EBR02_09545 [Alphaproteobacteria bacterium]|nr:hypothetical protein [Alphaproteobacteria bacterium]